MGPIREVNRGLTVRFSLKRALGPIYPLSSLLNCTGGAGPGAVEILAASCRKLTDGLDFRPNVLLAKALPNCQTTQGKVGFGTVPGELTVLDGGCQRQD